MKVLAFIGLAILVVFALLLLSAVLSGPAQYDPMSPDEEEKWLREQGLPEEDILRIMELPPR